MASKRKGMDLDLNNKMQILKHVDAGSKQIRYCIKVRH